MLSVRCFPCDLCLMQARMCVSQYVWRQINAAKWHWNDRIDLYLFDVFKFISVISFRRVLLSQHGVVHYSQLWPNLADRPLARKGEILWCSLCSARPHISGLSRTWLKLTRVFGEEGAMLDWFADSKVRNQTALPSQLENVWSCDVTWTVIELFYVAHTPLSSTAWLRDLTNGGCRIITGAATGMGVTKKFLFVLKSRLKIFSQV